MSAGASFAGKPYAKTARLTTGDNSLTAPTAKSKIFDPTLDSSGGATGLTIGALQRVTCAPVANITSATGVHIFRSPDGGTTLYYLFSVPIPVTTLTSGVMTPQQQSAGDQAFLKRYPVMVGVGDTLWAAVNDTVTGIDVTAEGGIG